MAEQLIGTSAAPLTPRTAWPTAVGRDWALRRVASRIPRLDGDTTGLSAELHLHPMLAVEFRRRRLGRGPAGELRAHALVDLVGGRSYVAEPWTEIDFQPIEDLPAAQPAPDARITRDQAVATARRMIGGVMLRRRRFDVGAPLQLAREPLCFAKPNWWVTGSCGGREVEVLVDAVTGRHYAFRA